MKKDWTKATKLRDPDGNIVVCRFEGLSYKRMFWMKTLGPCYKDGRLDPAPFLLFNESGKHHYGRNYTLILDEEEGNTDMKKVTFTSTAPVQQPTHWRNKATGSIIWKVGELWNRIRDNGVVEDYCRISVTPETHPSEFEPCYGDLVITISAEG